MLYKIFVGTPQVREISKNSFIGQKVMESIFKTLSLEAEWLSDTEGERVPMSLEVGHKNGEIIAARRAGHRYMWIRDGFAHLFAKNDPPSATNPGQGILDNEVINLTYINRTGRGGEEWECRSSDGGTVNIYAEDYQAIQQAGHNTSDWDTPNPRIIAPIPVLLTDQSGHRRILEVQSTNGDTWLPIKARQYLKKVNTHD